MAYATDYLTTCTGGSFFSALNAKMKARATYRRDRFDYTRLMGMDSHDLKDLGLTRDDVRERMMQPFHWTRA